MEKTPEIVEEIVETIKPEPKSNNNKLIIILVVLVIIGFSATSMLVGFMLAGKNVPMNANQKAEETTKVAIKEADSSPTPELATTSPLPTLKPNTKGSTYYSEKHKLGFYYGGEVTGTKVEEIGNKVYVYSKDTKPTDGQWVEVFTKDPDITLEQAITKQFLSGIPKEKCFVQPQKSDHANIQEATIFYPVPENSDEPFFMFGDACPAGYSRSNGMAYFYYDTNVPNKFFYFSIGQYAIPAYSDNKGTWQETFQAY